MNNLKEEKRLAVLSALVEGNSIRSTERMTGVHRDTIMRLLISVGGQCERFLDERMRELPCARIQVDELWGFIGKKQRHLLPWDDPTRLGDMWTWVAIDADTKLVPSYIVGKRDLPTAQAFLWDLSERLTNRIQLSSDSLPAYVAAVETAFGMSVDYGQIVKSYEAEPFGPGRYSPPEVVSAKRTPIIGVPDTKHISTSFVERQNLTMRMQIRRLTRLTNAFSKKLENFKAAVALHFAYYNFCRVHRSLRATPAMEAGLSAHPWSMSTLLSQSACVAG
jgi:IS1 family transposase